MVLGELYGQALFGLASPEIEHSGGRRVPLRAGNWLHLGPGDDSLLRRCQGPTLDVGAGPGRLTVALAQRGVPALAIDITPAAVELARSVGAPALQRDVFAAVPGTGRWARVLLADGNIGIGGCPLTLLRRIAELLGPAGRVLIEVASPTGPLVRERVRLTCGAVSGPWFGWASVGAGELGVIAGGAGLVTAETWTAAGRWFVSLARRAV